MTRIPIDDENLEDADFQRAGNGGPEAQPGGAPAGGSADEVAKVRAERDSLFERLARVSADFQNTRKRLEADMDQRVQYANGSLIKGILPVIDNFERALSVDPSKADAATILK